MPSYGQQTGGAGQAFWCASRKHNVNHQMRGGSLLAKNFNVLWCTLLNTLGKPNQPDYFAMLHSDVAAEPGWLDKLVELLEETRLDLLSVVIPIKSQHGLTSTAIERDDGCTWRVKRRLTMHEVFELPEVFTSEDVGGPLLVNTGCWVAKVGEWCREVSFTINDHIIQHPDTGQYQAFTEPEDWFFSRECRKIGLEIGSTRAVRVAHDGDASYRNDQPWGTQRWDEAMADEPIKPQGSFRFPDGVDGWLTYAEGRALYELSRGKRVLEIGSYCGKSTICIAQGAASVTCIDPFDGRGTPRPKDTHARFVANLMEFGVRGKVTEVIGTTADAGCRWPPFEVVFIDGDHDEDNVAADIEFAERVLAPGGLIVCHDYRRHPNDGSLGWDPGVTMAVDDYLTTGAELLARHDSLAVIRPRTKELIA